MFLCTLIIYSMLLQQHATHYGSICPANPIFPTLISSQSNMVKTFVLLEELAFSTKAEINLYLKQQTSLTIARTQPLHVQYIYKDPNKFDITHTCNFYICKNSFWIIESLDNWGSDNRGSIIPTINSVIIIINILYFSQCNQDEI